MKTKEKVPKIRFPGFSSEWGQRKLGDIFKEYSEKNHEELPALTIIQGTGTIKREESERNLQYDKSNLKGYKLVRKGDFIVHLRSFEGGLEKANTDGIVSPAYHMFHGDNMDTRFWYPYFRSYDFINNKLKPHVYGIRDGRSIDIEGMKSIKLMVPDYYEQKQIGDFIEMLDNLITLHQRKLEQMKEYKKGMLQKMFPKKGETVPEIRFPGFTGDWEQCKLSDLSIVSTGYPFDSKDFSDDGQYLVITNGNIQDESAIVNNSIGNHITVTDEKIITSYLLDIDDILVTMDGTVGRTAKVADNGQILAQRVGRIKAFENEEFLYQWLNTGTFAKAMVGLSHGGTIKHISLEEIRSFEAAVPQDADEQDKIGSFFEMIDKTITLHQRKLEEMKEYKKGLLQQMFV